MKANRTISKSVLCFLMILLFVFPMNFSSLNYTASAASTNTTDVASPVVTITCNQTKTNIGQMVKFYLRTTTTTKVRLAVSPESVAYIYTISCSGELYNQIFTAKPNKTYTIYVKVINNGYFALRAQYDDRTIWGSAIWSDVIYTSDTPNTKFNDFTKKIRTAYNKLPNVLKQWLQTEGVHIELLDAPNIKLDNSTALGVYYSSNKLIRIASGTDSLQRTLYHELGHAIQDCANKNVGDFDTYVKNIYNLYKKELKGKNSAFRNYAMSDCDEFFADAVAMYFMNPNQLEEASPRIYALIDVIIKYPEIMGRTYLDTQNINIKIQQPHVGYSETLKELSIKENSSIAVTKNQQIFINTKYFYRVFYKGKCVKFGKNVYKFVYTGTYTIQIILPFANNDDFAQSCTFTVKVTK